MKQKAEDSPNDGLVVLDEDGELFLSVGNSPTITRFQVCPATMRRTSRVWKAMLFGGWSETKPTSGPWNVSLPEDSSEAMRVVLAIIHGRFELLPPDSDWSLRGVYDIICMLNKYDIVKIIRPWVKTYMELANGDLTNYAPPLFSVPRSTASARREQSLYTAWELGNETLFVQRATEICLIATTSSFGFSIQLCNDDGTALSSIDHLGPHDFVGKSCC